MVDQRFGARHVDRVAVDSMLRDGLCCPIDGLHMGVHGGDIAREMGVSREEQDEWSGRSQQRYQEALSRGFFGNEIVAVENGKNTVAAHEQPPADNPLQKLPSLRPP